MWPVKKLQKGMLQDGQGFSYTLDQGTFSTVTQVVAATEDGLPKLIVCYASSAVTNEQGELTEPWKNDEVKVLMRLSRLRSE